MYPVDITTSSFTITAPYFLLMQVLLYAKTSATFKYVSILEIRFVALGFIIKYLTKNALLAWGVSIALYAAMMITFWVDNTKFEGLLPSIMTQLSLFERFYVFVNGVFDMTGIVYYLTVIAFFLFLSVQSLEKRRYN